MTLVYSVRGLNTVTQRAKAGIIGPGDVQWMTAGAGILHEEFHSANLPAPARS